MTISKQSHTKTNQDRRLQLIRLIHVGKRSLQLDDDTYRHLLLETTKKDSTKEMSVQHLERVLSALKNKGFVVEVKKSGSRPQAKDPQSKKIRALWLELHKAGHVQDPSESALAAYVKRITGVDALQWTNTQQASTVIESLKQWLNRVSNKPA